ncbi:hypothetical protein BKH46_08345 [Helicobacter sp. 12S02634-8]|uniref:hypothetical protein n=1 Tax=Helicobacter sp. 12S02634-8 TaxID=1476199 RepID=UPI000BA656EE|nr:hypothetical protein [Helicobacter sp. 12S02634-8]PAF46240.1 hypothetical protein BKH46_08345 [Helicobacter sp. 12S02634-8]
MSIQTENTPKIKRTFGNKRNIGEILYNAGTKEVFMNIQLGIFGKHTFSLRKVFDPTNENLDGGYEIIKTLWDKTNSSSRDIVLGRLFRVKNKEGNIVEGITSGTIGLLSTYDQDIEKTVTKSNDCLKIITHKLKDKIKLGDSQFYKIGYLTGQFAIETQEQATQEDNQVAEEVPFEEIADEEIPF